MIQKWAYMILRVKPYDSGGELLDECGNEGWELVSSTYDTVEMTTVHYFKRPIT